MGGRSSEHDVSISSGKEVCNNLNLRRYNIFPVVISKKDGRWISLSKEDLGSLDTSLKDKPQQREILAVGSNKQVENIQDLSKDKKFDLVFIALHGKGGEDGTIQGLLDLMGLSYTGSCVLASALGMNKLKFRKLMEAEKISIPKYLSLKKDSDLRGVEKKLTYPVFVKPNSQGSSIGTDIAKNRKELIRALKQAFKYDDEVLVDEYLRGLELTCAVIGNDKPIPLPIVEIRPLKGKFFDYKSKYSESGSEEIVPARISDALTKKVQEMAVKVYKTVGCRGFARIDIILKDNKLPVVLEINSIPGLTPMSLFPKAAKAAGISYSQLLDKIIMYALED